ncbi:hypothetical protein QTH97_09915 [Variovorax sp. J22R24]|uniref:hypothetical protein n=1 Tax=Variovorax gracilis TaxID=3053502 RepID=UPI002576AA24|nr:hypothetical protein [Variovorax sp. J22R24]MDM0105247.1 hypothetical protein [Variovorax sp. J22R24]
MKRWLGGCALASMLMLSGCSSLIAESASAGAGIAGGAIAGAITDSAAVASGIGIAVQALARAGVQYHERKIHGEVQEQIALAAGPLKVGQVKPWKTVLSLPLEPEQSGRVAVSRIISSGELDCKEIVVSVEQSGKDALPASEFYVAAICRSGSRWAWASAEPATERWGSLQ